MGFTRKGAGRQRREIGWWADVVLTGLTIPRTPDRAFIVREVETLKVNVHLGIARVRQINAQGVAYPPGSIGFGCNNIGRFPAFPRLKDPSDLD